MMTAIKTGRLFVISGIDGSGKSTLLRNIRARFEELNIRTVRRKFRSGPLKKLYLLLKPARKQKISKNNQRAEKTRRKYNAVPRNPVVKRIYLVITLLDIVLYALRLRWDLLRRRVIVIDRFYWDSQVELEEKFPALNLNNSLLWRLAARLAPCPDAAFLLHIPTCESVRRIQARKTQADQPAEVLAQRNARYKELSKDGRWIILDALQPPESVTRDAWAVIEGLCFST